MCICELVKHFEKNEHRVFLSSDCMPHFLIWQVTYYFSEEGSFSLLKVCLENSRLLHNGQQHFFSRWEKKTCLRMASRSVPETMGRGAEVARSLGRGQVGIPWAEVTKSHTKSVDRSSLPGRNPPRLVSQRTGCFGWVLKGVDFSIGKRQGRSGNTFHKSPLGSGDILLGIPKLSTPLVDPEAEKSAGQTPECCCNVLEAPGGSYPTLVEPSSDALWVSELRTSHWQGAGSGRQVQI